MGSYVPSTQEERQKMLQAIGLNSVEELYQDVPSQMLLHDQLNLPTGMSELKWGVPCPPWRPRTRRMPPSFGALVLMTTTSLPS